MAHTVFTSERRFQYGCQEEEDHQVRCEAQGHDEEEVTFRHGQSHRDNSPGLVPGRSFWWIGRVGGER